MESSLAQRLWHVVRAVLFMLRKGMAKRKLVADLHLLLRRGKIAGKALGNLVASHSHHGHAAAEAAATSFSCRALDPSLAVYSPRGREVEFSCSDTPSYPSLRLPKRHGRRRRRRDGDTGYYNYDAADIAKAFEILNSDEQLGDTDSATALATPPPARQLWITYSPCPQGGDDAEDGGGAQVDLQAEEFIQRFYEQLRAQQSLATATPDYYSGEYGYAPPVAGMA